MGTIPPYDSTIPEVCVPVQALIIVLLRSLCLIIFLAPFSGGTIAQTAPIPARKQDEIRQARDAVKKVFDDPTLNPTPMSYDMDRIGGKRVLVISGDLQIGADLQPLIEVLENNRPKWVALNSRGGSLATGIRIGRELRKRRINTIAYHDLICSSACAYAFMGGVERVADDRSIGVHQTSYSDEVANELGPKNAIRNIQRTTADLMAYASEMGVSPELMKLALVTSPEDIHYLTTTEMELYGVISTSAAIKASAPHKKMPWKYKKLSDQKYSADRIAHEAKTYETPEKQVGFAYWCADFATHLQIRLPAFELVDVKPNDTGWLYVSVDGGDAETMLSVVKSDADGLNVIALTRRNYRLTSMLKLSRKSIRVWFETSAGSMSRDFVFSVTGSKKAIDRAFKACNQQIFRSLKKFGYR